MKIIIICLIGLSIIAVGVSAEPRLDVGLKVGFNGAFNRSCWVPAKVEITNHGNGFSGNILITLKGCKGWSCSEEDKIPFRSYTYPISLSANETKEASIPLRISDNISSLRFQILSVDKVLYEKEITPDFDALSGNLVIVLTKHKERFAQLAQISDEKERVPRLIFAEPETLPEEWISYESLSSIIFNDIDISLLTPAQIEAVLAWTHSGGSIILTYDFCSVERNLRFLKRILPGNILGREKLTAPENLSAEVTGDKNIIQAATILRTDLPQELAIISDKGKNIITRCPIGLGSLVLIGFDSEAVTFESGNVRRASYNFLSKYFIPGGTYISKWNAYGERDILLPKIVRVSFLKKYIISFLILYVLILGPLNYLLLKRLDKREYILVSVPLVVILFVALVYFIGFKLRGKETLLSYHESVFMNPGEKLLLPEAEMGVLAADRENHCIFVNDFNVCVREPIEDAWDEYEHIGRFPINIHRDKEVLSISGIYPNLWSMRFFNLRTYRYLEESLEGCITLKEGNLVGEISNNFPFPLKNCWLLCKWNRYELGDLGSGQSRKFSFMPEPPVETEKLRCPRCKGYHVNTNWLDYHKDEISSEKEREFLTHVYEKYSDFLREPFFFFGFYEKPFLDASVNRESVKKECGNLVMVPLRLSLEGKRFSIPTGTTACFRKKTTPKDPLLGEAKLVYEFDLPFHSEKVKSNSLSVDLRLRKINMDENSFPMNLFLYDWQAGNWEEVSSDLKEGDLLKSIETPASYVKLPQGIVKIRVEGEKKETNLSVAFIDISYEGEVK